MVRQQQVGGDRLDAIELELEALEVKAVVLLPAQDACGGRTVLGKVAQQLPKFAAALGLVRSVVCLHEGC